MKLLKEITLLTEAAGGVVALPMAKKVDGESIWGYDGFTPSTKPLEDQVKAYVNKMVKGADEEELQHFYDEIGRVVFVPKKVYDHVTKAYTRVNVGGDAQEEVINAFVQHLFVDAASKIVAVKIKPNKK